jgi:hypothetical protein
MAADEAARGDLTQRWRFRLADVDRVSAAGVEIAASRRVGWIGNLAFEEDPFRA